MARPPHIDQALCGWGRFPVEPCHLYRPEKRREVAAILESGAEPSYIARGLGRSYGDAALNLRQGAVSFTHLNRFMAFDPATGILECEAGVSFAEIIETFLARGFFLPVTPGTKFVTVGGAIAANIHGKNHHRDGSIANFVSEIRLLTPGGQVQVCSPAVDRDIFWATAGGMGLTGMILTAKLRLERVESAYVLADYQKARNLDEALDLMAATDDRFRYSVAWMYCLARGDALGRSVLMRGNHALAGELPREIRDPLALPKRMEFRVPDLPSFALNRASIGAFNTLYYALYRNATGQRVDFERYFYPLDRIQSWNRLYGNRGFVQYQVALPLDGGEKALKALLRQLSDSGRGSFLAVLKRLGAADPGPLSFPLQGYTLALDLPFSRDLASFLYGLDQIVQGYGGRVYLAKDAVLRPETFAAMYPRLDAFRAVKARLDPKGRLSSSLARRLKIVD